MRSGQLVTGTAKEGKQKPFLLVHRTKLEVSGLVLVDVSSKFSNLGLILNAITLIIRY